VEAELVPLCGRVDFRRHVCAEMKVGKPYYWVTQKKLFWLYFKYPTEISSQSHETKITGTKWSGSSISP
jgi:hypothetical protein